MKIGLIIYGSLDTLSGGYLYDRQLVKHLRSMGHQVDILSLPWRTYAAHLSDNLRIAWARKIVDARYDVLLQDELNHPSLFLLNSILRQQRRTPIISIVHHLRLAEEHPAYLKPLYSAVERLYLRSVDGFIYNSHTTRRLVQQQIGESKSNVVAYPAADHRHPPSHAEVVNTIAAQLRTGGPLQFLFIGNLMARKGLHTVLNALARIVGQRWHLHIVGSTDVDPTYSAAMIHHANTLSLTSKITWHGRVSDERLAALLIAGNVLVMPSYEGFGIVYLEAMAYGLPVIAADTGAAPELISPGINGYLCHQNDNMSLSQHLHLLLDNRVHLATLAYYARMRYEAHATWAESALIASEWLHEIST